MAGISEAYSERVMQQRTKRKRTRAQYEEVIDSSSDYDTDSVSDTTDVDHFSLIDDETPATIVRQHKGEDKGEGDVEDHYFPNECGFKDYYFPDECDNIDIDDYSLFSDTEAPPLYQHSTTSIGEA